MRLFNQTKSPESIKEQIGRLLTEDKLRFAIVRESEQQLTFNLGMALSSGNVDSYIDVQSEQDIVEMLTFSPVNIPENKREEVIRFFNLISQTLYFGHFELNVETGQIRVKTYLVLSIYQSLPDEIIKRCFYGNLNLMDRYFPGVLQIVYGNSSAQKAVETIHNEIDPRLN
jgi:hypothetical protein